MGLDEVEMRLRLTRLMEPLQVQLFVWLVVGMTAYLSLIDPSQIVVSYFVLVRPAPEVDPFARKLVGLGVLAD